MNISLTANPHFPRAPHPHLDGVRCQSESPPEAPLR